jgi:serum/glucocorticoid-regulated kinase 3
MVLRSSYDAAPEVLKKHSYGRPVDWWCLGCVTFEMMCGLPPFYSRDCNEMYDRILHDSISFPDFVPGPARSFLRGLLVRIPDQRLGGSIKDAEDVMGHEFFDGMDWDALDRRELEPPFKPGVKGDYDLSNIDPQFTTEPVPMSVMPETAVSAVSVTLGDKAAYDAAFDGFSFQGTGAIGKAR